MLSRVDGSALPAQIALETGLDAEAVRAALARLAELGAIQTRGTVAKPVRPPSASAASGPRAAPSPPEEPVIIDRVQLSSEYDPRELDEPADLTPERKKLILDHFHALETVDHYRLLGLPRSADRADVKRAYNEKVSLLHPDKYFRKNLGAFGPKLAVVFKRVTEAHDVLSRRKRRAEYDAYLDSIRATRPFEQRARSGEHRLRVREIQLEIEQEAREAVRVAERSLEPAEPQPAPQSPDTATIEPEERLTPSRPSMTPEERRLAAARRFGTFSSRPPAPRASAPDPVAAREQAAAHIRRVYESKVVLAASDRIAQYVAQADEADGAGDPLAAANALRLAVSLAPEDEALVARLEDADTRAATKLAGKYTEQAAYRESRGELTEASATYEKALRGRADDAALHARAAACYFHDGKNLKRAAELAKRAVELAPDVASYRTTLARAYARAGMIKSALGELDRAKTLAPGDDSIKQLIKQIRRGDG